MNQLFSVPAPVVRIGRTPAVARANGGYLSGGTHLVLSLIFLCVVGLFASSARAVIPESERQVLIDIYNAMNGPNWTEQGGWLGPPGTECSWLHVYCNLDGTNEDGPNIRVLDLGLDSSGRNPIGLTGPLPSLTSLSQLYGLNITGGDISQMPDPSELPPSLQVLILDGCGIEGEMPDFSVLPQLEYIWLPRNNLSGPIPPSIGMLPNLKSLQLDSNNITGEIPDLSGATALQEVLLSYNNLTGATPSLPQGILTFEALGNALTEFGPKFPISIVTLNLSLNQITGPIPATMSSLVNLQLIDLSFNNLTGEIPSFAGLAPDIVRLNNNELTQLPESIGDTRHMMLQDNLLQGNISINSSSLIEFNADENTLLTLTQLIAPNLEIFQASYSGLLGTLPDLTQYPNLQAFIIKNGAMRGHLPKDMSVLQNLSFFAIDGNKVTGELPDLSSLQKLFTFVVSNNLLTGNIPDLPPQIAEFSARNNSLIGGLPDFTSFSGIAKFDVSENELTGPLPDLSVVTGANGLGKVGIYLSKNHFTGQIHSGISENIEWLGLNGNELSGVIPDLDRLPNLQLVTLANNRFTGNPPAITVRLRDENSGLNTLCPNLLNPVPSEDWDIATGVSPWYTSCLDPDAIFMNGFEAR